MQVILHGYLEHLTKASTGVLRQGEGVHKRAQGVSVQLSLPVGFESDVSGELKC